VSSHNSFSLESIEPLSEEISDIILSSVLGDCTGDGCDITESLLCTISSSSLSSSSVLLYAKCSASTT
jgi:hypothetical protein